MNWAHRKSRTVLRWVQTLSNIRSLGSINTTSTGRKPQRKEETYLKLCSSVIWLQCDLAIESWINNGGDMTRWFVETWWEKAGKINGNNPRINQMWATFASLAVFGCAKHVMRFLKSDCNLLCLASCLLAHRTWQRLSTGETPVDVARIEARVEFWASSTPSRMQWDRRSNPLLTGGLWRKPGSSWIKLWVCRTCARACFYRSQGGLMASDPVPEQKSLFRGILISVFTFVRWKTSGKTSSCCWIDNISFLNNQGS